MYGHTFDNQRDLERNFRNQSWNSETHNRISEIREDIQTDDHQIAEAKEADMGMI